MHQKAVQIRRLRPEEWADYREIRLRALRSDPDSFGSTWASESARSAADWRERAERSATGAERAVFVAVPPDGQWLGLVGVYRPGEPPADAEIVSMWVDPRARRHRLGERLISAGIDWAESTGADVLGLWVTRANSGAIALYSGLGFEETGDIQPLPSNPCKEELRMLRRVRGMPQVPQPL